MYMQKGRPWKGTVAAATVTMIALSPALSPVIARATTTASGQISDTPTGVVGTPTVPVNISFDASVTNPGSDAFEYQVTLQDPTNPSVNLSLSTLATAPTFVDAGTMGGSVSMAVNGDYASYDASAAATQSPDTGDITLQLPAGNFVATLTLVDTTTGDTIATQQVPITVESATVSSTASSISATSADDVNLDVNTAVYSPAAGSSYSYQVQLLDSNGNPMDIPGSTVAVSENGGTSANDSWDTTQHALTYAASALSSGSPSEAASFDLGTLAAGQYAAVVTVSDAVYGVLGTTNIPISITDASQAGSGGTSTISIAGTVYAPYGSSLPNSSGEPVAARAGTLIAVDMGTNTTITIPVQSDGTFSASNLAAGTYQITQYQSADGGDTFPIMNAQVSSTTTDLSVNLPAFLYFDESQTPTNIQPDVASTFPITLQNATVTNQVYVAAAIDQISNNSSGSTGMGGSTNEQLTPVSTATLSVNVGGTTIPLQWDDTQQAYISAPFAIPTGTTTLPVSVTFPQNGTYLFDPVLTDATNGLNLGGEGTPVTVGGNSVTGTVYGSDGTTPIANAYLALQDANGNPAWASTNAAGQFTAQLQDGTWTVQAIYLQDGSSTTYSDPSTAPQIVVSGGQVTGGTVDIVDSQTVIGTAYQDNAQRTPLANTYLTVQSAGASDSSAQQWFDILTEANGKFVSALPGGSYVVTGEWNENSGQYTPTSIPFDVSGSAITIAPKPNNYDLTVDDPYGQAAAAGSYLIIEPGTAGNAGQLDWSTAQWLPIGANGEAAGYLIPGTYTVAGLQTADGNYYPISDTTISVTDSGSPLQETIGPSQPLVYGTVMKGNSTAPYTTLVVVPATASQGDWSQAVYLTADGSGSFTDNGWLSTTNAFGDELHKNTDYTIVGAWDQNGTFYPLSQALSVGTSPTPVTVSLPVPNVTGTVAVDGTQIQNGWIGFDAVGDTAGAKATWASVQNGSYSISLPVGSYNVTGVGDDQGHAYDTSSSNQVVTVTDANQVLTDNINVSYNFTGTLVSQGTQGLGNATMMLSPIAHPGTQDDWNQVVYVNTDANGAFQGNLDTSKSWYLVGVLSETGGYAQLSQAVSISTGETVSIAPNTTATVTFPTAPSNGYLVLKDSAGNFYNAQGQSSGSFNQMSFSFTLPRGDTYSVVGVVTEDSSANETWTDLSSQALSVNVPTSGSAQALSIDLSTTHSGTINGWSQGQGGYVVFQKTATDGTTEETSVPFTSDGSFTTVFDGNAGWHVAGIETTTTFVAASGSYQNGQWTVTQNL